MTVYGSLASALKPNEKLWDFSYILLLIEFCRNQSYRSACFALNKALHRSPGTEIKYRTVADFVEKLGNHISEDIQSAANSILRKNHFNPETNLPEEDAALPVSIVKLDIETTQGLRNVIHEKIEQINAEREPDAQIKHLDLAEQIESPSQKCCYISIDDIGVKHQKEHRGDNSTKKGKYIENTVIHVQADGNTYYFTAVGMDKAFSALLSFLLQNDLMKNRRLVFFTDGARDIKKRIESVFGFRQFTIVLDWFHLKKKCKELISSSVKGGKDKKQEIIQHILRMLWVGNADEACTYLRELDSSKIKSVYWRNILSDYIERKAPDIACYALRNALGLRVSSNRVEKANDLIVGQRQKHNGMSWSFDGSGALAAIDALILNNELENWLRTGQLLFSMQSNKVKIAA